MYRVVQLSLLGSILSNLLLVLGCSCFLGGLRYKIQTFTTVSGSVNPGLLLLATSGLALPAALKLSGQIDGGKERENRDTLEFSRCCGLIMLCMYGGYLYFSLKTNLFEYEEKEKGKTEQEEERGLLDKGTEGEEVGGKPSAPLPPPPFPLDPDDELTLTYGCALKWLCLITALISVLSDVLIGTIEGFTHDNNVNPVFVAAVVIPIMGNAAEHAASVMFAWKGKIDISVAICVGSSIQIALCVLPACVTIGWATGREFDMFFEGYETVTLVLSVVVVSFLLQGGTSNWLAGAMLGGLYVMIAYGFWIHEGEEGEWGEGEGE